LICKLEAMIPVIEGKENILVSVNKEREIKEAIEWAAKQKVKIVLIACGGSVQKCTKAKSRRRMRLRFLVRRLALPGDEDDAYDRAFQEQRVTYRRLGLSSLLHH
jgi:hypothetical protein